MVSDRFGGENDFAIFVSHFLKILLAHFRISLGLVGRVVGFRYEGIVAPIPS